MKCIKRNGKLKVERVNDDLARELVLAGKAEYTPKKVWKKEVRDAK